MSESYSVTEHGVLFVNKAPVSFPFKRCTEPSPNCGSTYQQDIEVAGRYMIHAPHRAEELPGWERGIQSFECPLVMLLNANLGSGAIYDENSWKAILHDRYGCTGEALRIALLQDGYDGVVTLGSYKGKVFDTREIVALGELRDDQHDCWVCGKDPEPDMDFLASRGFRWKLCPKHQVELAAAVVRRDS